MNNPEHLRAIKETEGYSVTYACYSNMETIMTKIQTRRHSSLLYVCHCCLGSEVANMDTIAHQLAQIDLLALVGHDITSKRVESDQRSSTLFHVFRGDTGDTWGLFRSFAADYAYATSRRQYLACTRHPKSEQSVRNKAPPVLNVLSDKSAHAIPWA